MIALRATARANPVGIGKLDVESQGYIRGIKERGPNKTAMDSVCVQASFMNGWVSYILDLQKFYSIS